MVPLHTADLGDLFTFNLTVHSMILYSHHCLNYEKRNAVKIDTMIYEICCSNKANDTLNIVK